MLHRPSGGAFLRAGGRPSLGTGSQPASQPSVTRAASSYKYATQTVTYEAVLNTWPQMSRATGRPASRTQEGTSGGRSVRAPFERVYYFAQSSRNAGCVIRVV